MSARKRTSARIVALVFSIGIASIACNSPAPAIDAGRDAGRDAGDPIAILAFSRTAEFRHASIEPAVDALREESSARGWIFEHTEDPARFTDAELARFDAIVFLMTSGDVLDEEQQRAMERFVEAGGGFVGVHSASDTEYDWPWYGALVGAYFLRHPAVQRATIHVEAAHPSTMHLPAAWDREDEWYDFRENPRDAVAVLLTVDETTYEGGAMGADHPIAWHNEVGAGRSFYTALGHTIESWRDPLFVAHVAGGIAWAAR